MTLKIVFDVKYVRENVRISCEIRSSLYASMLKATPVSCPHFNAAQKAAGQRADSYPELKYVVYRREVRLRTVYVRMLRNEFNIIDNNE